MLPIREISNAGAGEKSRTHGRINNLHRWWATRPTNVARITTYAALVCPPLSDHEDVMRDMYDYVKSTDRTKPAIRERIRERIRKINGCRIPKVLDPFGGSGALPFAAAWLGCDSHSMDYNPVAIFVQKCALEYPAKYGKGLVDDIQNVACAIQQEIREVVEGFYPNGEMDDGLTYDWYGYRWCRTIPCTCGATIPLVKSYVLSKRRGICLYPKNKDRIVQFGVAGGLYDTMPEGFDPKKGSIGGNVVKCVACGHTYNSREMRAMFNNGKGGEQNVGCHLHPSQKARTILY